MNKRFIIGLTGPSGSGKSAFADILNEYGLPFICADAVAREVVEAGSPCLDELKEKFGGDIIRKDGSLDRKKLAEIAFSSHENTQLLNEITHPFIMDNINGKITALAANGAKCVILDAPQLFESGADKICDMIVVVTAPYELRKARIMLRDGIDEAAAQTRMSAALNDDFFKSHANAVICNDGSTDELKVSAKGLISDIERRLINFETTC